MGDRGSRAYPPAKVCQALRYCVQTPTVGNVVCHGARGAGRVSRGLLSDQGRIVSSTSGGTAAPGRSAIVRVAHCVAREEDGFGAALTVAETADPPVVTSTLGAQPG